MKLNRKWLLVIALVVSMATAISGTLAYLTDRDSEVNTFTMGDVSIDLEENFTPDSELLPGNKVEKETFITNTGDSDAYVWMTMAVPAALDDENAELGTGSQALHWNVPGVVWKGYGDTSWATAAKVQTAKDNGWVTDAHIGDNGRVKADCLWTICQTADAPVPIKTETIDGVNYNVYTFLYNGVLAKDATTPVALNQVYLDTKIDVDPNGKWYLVNNGEVTDLNWTNNDQIKVIVSAYAIQAEGFNSVEDAYKAYNAQWGDNGTEYDGGIPTTPWTDTADISWYTEDTDSYKIDTAAELAGLSELVNSKKVDFAGKTITLTADVDLGAHQWTPIGQTGATEFKGVFDGGKHTISNLYVDSSAQTGAYYSSGLFGWIESHAQDITIKNVTIDGATITGHHNVAVIAGYMEGDSVIENCHVKNATLSNTVANDDANGDKTGSIAGYAAGEVRIKNCTAENVKIDSGRDAGQIVGAAKTVVVESCTATNVTVTANGTGTGANINEAVIGRVL